MVGISEWFAGNEMKKWKETKRNQRKWIDFKSEQKAKKKHQMERNAGPKANSWKMTVNVRNQRQPKKMTGNEMKWTERTWKETEGSAWN